MYNKYTRDCITINVLNRKYSKKIIFAPGGLLGNEYYEPLRAQNVVDAANPQEGGTKKCVVEKGWALLINDMTAL